MYKGFLQLLGKLGVAAVCLLWSALCYSHEFSINDLHFYSNGERQLFEAYFDGEPDYFKLLYEAYYKHGGAVEMSRSSFYKRVEQFKDVRYQKAKPAKFVKQVYAEMEKAYLHKYIQIPGFDEMFKWGSYNCVTSTALFALCFEELDQPYDIRLMPQHVYLIFHPDDEAIKVEATNPQQPIQVPDARFKEGYIEYLRAIKVLSQAELDSTSVEYLFEKHFYAPKKITLENLVGVQYYNLGWLYMQQDKFLEAFYQFEKSLVFFMDPLIQFMVKLSLQAYLTEVSLKNNSMIDLFIQHTNYARSESDHEFSKYLYGQFVNEMLVEKGYPDTLCVGHKKIMNNIKDTLLGAEMDYYYQFEMGRYYYRTGSSNQALPYFEEAFQNKPDNIDAQSAIVSLLTWKLQKGSPAEEVLAVTEKYYQEYPQLQNNRSFEALHASVILSVAQTSFRMNKPKEAFTYIEQFEEIFEQSEDIELSREYICDVYVEAAVYYFGRNYISKAKACIERGLEIDPGNYRLRQLRNNF